MPGAVATAATMSVDRLLDSIFVFRACDLVDQQAVVNCLPDFMKEHPQVGGGCSTHPPTHLPIMIGPSMLIWKFVAFVCMALLVFVFAFVMRAPP